MKPEEMQDFTALLAGVYEFYAKECSDLALSVWWNAVAFFEFASVRDAFNRHVVNPDSGQYLPKPADIVRMLNGGTQDTALVAWSKVDRAVRAIGPYASVEFDDPIIPAVLLDMGGWITLGNKSEDEWPFVRNEFVTRYRGFVLRGDAPAPAVLPGIHETQNAVLGHEHRSAVRVIAGRVAQRRPRLAGPGTDTQDAGTRGRGATAQRQARDLPGKEAPRKARAGSGQ